MRVALGCKFVGFIKQSNLSLTRYRLYYTPSINPLVVIFPFIRHIFDGSYLDSKWNLGNI